MNWPQKIQNDKGRELSSWKYSERLQENHQEQIDTAIVTQKDHSR